MTASLRKNKLEHIISQCINHVEKIHNIPYLNSYIRRQVARTKKGNTQKKTIENSLLPKVFFCSLNENSKATILPVQYIPYLPESKLFPHIELFEMPFIASKLYNLSYDSNELSKMFDYNSKFIYSRQIRHEDFNDKALLKTRRMALKYYFSLLEKHVHISLSSMTFEKYDAHPFFKAHSNLLKTQNISKKPRLVPVFYDKIMRLVTFNKQEFLKHDAL